MNVDSTYAKEKGTGKVMAKSHCWQSYENIFALKSAIEKSGWKTKKDTPAVIKALEGLEMKNSLAHPQGSKKLRAQDHSGIIDCYMSRVENSKFVLKKRIPKEEMEKILPPRYDFTKYSL